jgi:hypothetical protein
LTEGAAITLYFCRSNAGNLCFGCIGGNLPDGVKGGPNEVVSVTEPTLGDDASDYVSAFSEKWTCGNTHTETDSGSEEETDADFSNSG